MKLKSFVITFLFLTTSFVMRAQECTTIWPYLYPEFKTGVIYTVGGQKYEFKVNIHVQESRLHYLDNNTIKETRSQDVLLVTVGEDTFFCVNGYIMKVIGSEEKGFVATLVLGDFDKLIQSSGAYGISNNSSSTRQLTSIEEVGGKTNVNHMELRENRDNGKALDLIYKYFLVVKGKTDVIPATKKDIIQYIGPGREKDFKTFLKKNKIKWKDPNSLLTLLDFFN